MPEDIMELLERDPFEPFVIVTGAGQKYRVDHPHSMAMMTGRIFVAPRRGKWVFIKIGQIAAIEAASKAA